MYVDEIRIFKLNYDKIIPALQKHLYNVLDIQQSTLGLARCLIEDAFVFTNFVCAYFGGRRSATNIFRFEKRQFFP